MQVVGKISIFRPVEKSPAQTPCRRKLCPSAMVFLVHDDALAEEYAVPSIFGGSRSLLITVTVRLTSKRLVVWKSVDDTHGLL